MDLFEVLEDELDDFFDRISRPRKSPVVRNRVDHFAKYDEEEFRNRFRLTKSSCSYVLSLIEDDIKTNTDRNAAISPKNRLLLTLRYYATGCFLRAIGDLSGVSIASASRIVAQVSLAIAKLRPAFVKFPSDFGPIIQGFYEIARFPGVVGVIDCTHVNIKSPGGNNAEDYRDRHGNFSLNVQTVVDHNLKIMDIVARWPGSCHDQTIFNNSRIGYRLTTDEFENFYILGDRGYANRNYLLTPLHNPSTPAENLYNESQIRTRNVVERSYGVWKSRFPVLSKKITVHHSKIQTIIVSCAVLHNIAIIAGEEHFNEDYVYYDNANSRPHEVDNNIVGNSRRSILITGYFSSLL